MKSVLIRDGYTWKGKFGGGDTGFPLVTWKYRPALPDEVHDYHQEKRENGKAAQAAHVRLLAKHLVSWDIPEENEAGDCIGVVPLTPENIRCLLYPLQMEMVNTVLGYSWGEAEKDVKN
jgi:hypothetical protein